VRAAIDLDDEFQLPAEEVGEEGSDRGLANELQAVELAVAQVRPQNVFSCARFRAQRSGAIGSPRLRASHGMNPWDCNRGLAAPHPNPLPVRCATGRGDRRACAAGPHMAHLGVTLPCNTSAASGPEASAQSVEQAARLSRNVRQPNGVLANSIAGYQAEWRSSANEEWFAAPKHEGAEVEAILIDQTRFG
jgi:hypothetical protein